MSIIHGALNHVRPHRFFCLNKQDTPSGFYTDLFTLRFVTEVARDITWYNNHIQEVIKNTGVTKGALKFSIFGDHNRFFYIKRDHVNRYSLVGQDYGLKDVEWRLGSKNALFSVELLNEVLSHFEIDPVEFKQITYNFLASRDLGITAKELARPAWYRRLLHKKELFELEGAEGGGFFDVWFTQEHFLFKPSVTHVQIRRQNTLESARSDYKGNGIRITAMQIAGDVDHTEVTQWINQIQTEFLLDWDNLDPLFMACHDSGKFKKTA